MIYVFSPRALVARAYPSSTSLYTRLYMTLGTLLDFDSRTVGYDIPKSCRIPLIVSEEYQYATMSAYSPTITEITLNGEIEGRVSSRCHTDAA
jgi:hypothetical protein